MISMLAGQVIATCLLSQMHCAVSCTDTVYVADDDGKLAKSKDGGDTWSTVLTNVDWIYDVQAQNSNVYVATPNGLYVSHDSGASWSMKNLHNNGSDCDPTVYRVFIDVNKRVYALSSVNNGCGRIALSSDNGETWPINVRFPNPQFAHTAKDIYVDGSRIYIASSDGLGYTDDLGASWTFKNHSSGLGSNSVRCVIGRGQTIYVGLEGDGAPVSMSADGGRTWKTANVGRCCAVWSMYLRDDTLYASTDGSGLSWSNDFTNWTTKTIADGLAGIYTFMIVVSGDSLYLGTANGLSISRDKGQTWITKTTKDGLPSNMINAVFALCV